MSCRLEDILLNPYHIVIGGPLILVVSGLYIAMGASNMVISSSKYFILQFIDCMCLKSSLDKYCAIFLMQLVFLSTVNRECLPSKCLSCTD